MTHQFHPLAIVLISISLVALLVAFWVAQRQKSLLNWFSLMMAAIALWGMAYGFELASPSLEQMLFWIRIEYLGISTLPALWLVFILKYIGQDEWLNRRLIGLLFAYSAVTYLLVLTNPWHHWYYAAVQVDRSGPFPLLAIEPGFWYHLHTAVFYFLIALGYLLLFLRFRNTDRLFKRQNQLILLSTAIPWLVNIGYIVFDFKPYGHIDLTPFAFLLSALLIATALIRYRLFDLVPMARNQIIGQLSDGILVFDSFRRVVDCNAAMQKILGRSREELFGLSADAVLESKALQELIGRTLPDDGPGRIVWPFAQRDYEVSLSVLQGPRNRLTGTVLLFKDISDRLRNERELKRKTQELIEINALKDRLFSIIAHDLRGPLQNLQEILQLIDNDLLDREERKELLDNSRSELSQNTALLENLLYWGRSQLKGEQLKLEPFSFNELAKEVESELMSRAEQKGLSLYTDLCLPGKDQVRADREMQRIVLRNLVSNAIKFCNAGDRIAIRTKPEGDTLSIQVEDSGIGMDPAAQKRLFTDQHFSRTGTAQEKGTGLGLLLCRDFVARNGGELKIESSKGKGSTFYYNLPLAP